MEYPHSLVHPALSRPSHCLRPKVLDVLFSSSVSLGLQFALAVSAFAIPLESHVNHLHFAPDRTTFRLVIRRSSVLLLARSNQPGTSASMSCSNSCLVMRYRIIALPPCRDSSVRAVSGSFRIHLSVPATSNPSDLAFYPARG